MKGSNRNTLGTLWTSAAVHMCGRAVTERRKECQLGNAQHCPFDPSPQRQTRLARFSTDCETWVEQSPQYGRGGDLMYSTEINAKHNVTNTGTG
jgi:hypothetical protein